MAPTEFHLILPLPHLLNPALPRPEFGKEGSEGRWGDGEVGGQPGVGIPSSSHSDSQAHPIPLQQSPVCISPCGGRGRAGSSRQDFQELPGGSVLRPLQVWPNACLVSSRWGNGVRRRSQRFWLPAPAPQPCASRKKQGLSVPPTVQRGSADIRQATGQLVREGARAGLSQEGEVRLSDPAPPCLCCCATPGPLL